MRLQLIKSSICFFTFCILAMFAMSMPYDPPFVETRDGVIIYPNTNISGNVKAVKLQVVSDKIIRVIASVSTSFSAEKSLITVYPAVKKNWVIFKKGDLVCLKTKELSAMVMLSTGAVSFLDKNGMPVLSERKYNGRMLSPVVVDGQSSLGMRQTFETSSDDNWYGLGQHQDGQFNHRGGQVFMFQNNTEVAIPFLLSSKNYGILWDNYSLTKAGDTRDFMPLSTLRLFSQDGQSGWLTTTYVNDREKPSEILFTKAESIINYPFLGDTKERLSKEFNPAKGMITWEGAISSGFKGMHKFLLTYGGYIKVWINGKLLVDRWRQSWNPGSVTLNLEFAKDQKYPVKIQWIPDGSESYISTSWLNPIPAADVNSFSFSSEAGKQIDYYFVHGANADEVISGYRSITGKSTIVPRWAMGFWQSRERYKTQEEILSTAAEFRKRQIPIDNIVQDWSYWKQDDWGSQQFDSSRFVKPDSMIRVLHDTYQMKFMISVWPKMYEGIPAYKDFDAKGWLYKRNIADRQRDWIGEGYISTFYDAFNKDARKGFWNLINKNLYSKGVDAWWMDASEPDILSNVSPQRRKDEMSPTAVGPAAEYLNAYPLENAKGIFEGQRSVDPDKRVFLLTRSGFAGSQHYGATIWSGDISATWGDMKTQISAGLGFSMSGLPFWTMDIGGFASQPKQENAKGEDLEEWRELQARWYQFGAFVPLFRAHGQFPFREIFNIAPEEHPAYKSMLFYNKLRYRLMPYIYTLAGMTYHQDYTIMRGLVMDFPNDPAVKNIGEQYMFGPSLLINPVYDYKERRKEIYLPAGQGWYDLYSGEYRKGGQKVTVDAPYERMPVLVKEGSILPFGPTLQYTSEKKADTVTLCIYTGRDAFFQLYEDEDTTYNYEKGFFSNIPMSFKQASGELTIGKRTGNFPGMLSRRVFRIIFTTPQTQKKMDIDRVADRTVLYDGNAVRVKLP